MLMSSTASRQLIRDRIVLGAVLLSLAIHLGILVVARPWDLAQAQTTLLVADAGEYHRIASQIAEGAGLSAVSPLRTPGYPAFLALFYRVFGASTLLAPLVAQVLLDVAILLIVARIALQLTNSMRVARYASVLFALSVLSAFYASRLVTETLFTAVFLAALLALVKGIQQRSLSWIAASGLLLGAATLIRPVTQYYGLLVVGVLFLLLATSRRGRLVAAVVFLLANVIALSPVLGYNLSRHGHAELATIQGYNLLRFHAAYTMARAENLSVEAARAELDRELPDALDAFDLAAAQQRLALSVLLDHPATAATVMAEGIIRMLGGTGQNIVANEILGLEDAPASDASLGGRLRDIATGGTTTQVVGGLLALKLLLEYALFSAGLVVAIRGKNWLLVALVVGTVAYYALAAGAAGDARLRVPVLPLLAIAAGVGTVSVLDWAQEAGAWRSRFRWGKSK